VKLLPPWDAATWFVATLLSGWIILGGILSAILAAVD